ncbi:hypothetical protein ACFLWH_02430 [Chloroflexota bacterium]
MDFEDIGKFVTYLIPVIILVLTNVVFKKQRQQQTKLKVVRGLLSEIDFDQKLIDAFSMQWQIRKFKTGTWKRNKDKMDYIDPGLRYTLADAFEIAEEFNREIDSAKQHKSTSYLAGIRVDRLVGPLAKSKLGLEEWLELNQSKKKLPKGTQ